MRAALRGSPKIGPSLPTWQTTFPFPGRIRNFWYGLANSVSGDPTLANAQTTFSSAQVAKWTALSPKIQFLRHRFDWYDLWRTPTLTAIPDPTNYAGIKYVAQVNLAAGLNLVLNPHDDQGGGPVHNGLHLNAAGTHFNWDWFVLAWTNLVKSLEVDLGASGFGPDRVILELVNEMGYNAQALWSMATYNSFLAYVVPRLRTALPGYTFAIDLYPYGSPNQYTDAAFGGGGTLLALPDDKNLVVGIHSYHPGGFTNQGITDTSPSGMHYISGIPWGSTRAQIQSYLDTYDPGIGTGDALLDAQIAYWRANLNNEVDSYGFTSATFANIFGPLISYLTTNKRMAMCLEYGPLGYSAASPYQMPLAHANAYETSHTGYLASIGIPSCGWIYQTWTDKPLVNDGSNSFVASRVASNASRTAPL